MAQNTKKKINLTITEDVLDKAKKLVEHRGESLSSVVEDFLARLVSDIETTQGDWLDAFHKRFIPRGFKEPSDIDIQTLRDEQLRRS